MELLYGARNKVELETLKKVLHGFHTLSLSAEIGRLADQHIEQFSLSHGMEPLDALIAATAMELDMVLCTANMKHFRAVPGLKLESFRP